MLTQLKETLRPLRQLFTFVTPYRKMFWWVAFLAVFFSGLGVARSYVFKLVVDNYILLKDYNGLIWSIVIMALMLFAEVGSQVSFNYYSNWLAQYVIKDIRNQLFGYMMRFRMAYYNRSSVGQLVTNSVNDMERIGEIFSAGFFEILSDFLKMIIVVVVMLFVDWRLALIVFATLPIMIYATHWFQKSMNIAFTDVRREVANLNAFVQERISGMKIIQLFTQERPQYQKFKQINKKHRTAWLKNIWYNSVFFPIVEVLTSIAIGLVVWYGGLQSMGGEIQLGTIFMFIQLIHMLFRPLRQMADKFNTLQLGLVSCQRVFSIINQRQENAETSAGDDLNVTEGVIRFEEVSFGYKENEPILKNISFEVAQGQKVAIVGATGAGKSTIINLINRFYEIDGGEILIDNQVISAVSLASLRKNIGMVLQDVFLFADTILNNITLKNPDISYQEVVQAAKEIEVHSFIEQLPDGYYYNVKERGAMLSVGQRQLIAFLRAYVHRPKILILDEATSSVDSHLEKRIQAAIDKITEGRTSIIIAHRLATIQKADKIIVLDKGQIVEEGTHHALLQIPNGYYRALYEVQFGNSTEDKAS